MSRRRVVVTGLGLISPLGIGVEKSWGGLLEGRSGVRRITHFDTSSFATKIAGEVDGFIAVNGDGSVTIFSGKVDLGQGLLDGLKDGKVPASRAPGIFGVCAELFHDPTLVMLSFNCSTVNALPSYLSMRPGK